MKETNQAKCMADVFYIKSMHRFPDKKFIDA